MCAISGVWLFDSRTPLSSMKLSRFGMQLEVRRDVGVVPEEVNVVKADLDNVPDAIGEMAAALLPLRGGFCSPG